MLAFRPGGEKQAGLVGGKVRVHTAWDDGMEMEEEYDPHTHTHTTTHTHTHTNTHTHKYTNTHEHTRTHTHKYTNTHEHTHTHNYANTHEHAPLQMKPCVLPRILDKEHGCRSWMMRQITHRVRAVVSFFPL